MSTNTDDSFGTEEDSSFVDELQSLLVGISLWVDTQRDLLNAKVQNVMAMAVLVFFGGLLGFAVILSVVHLFISSVVTGLAQVFDFQLWAGQLLSSSLLLGLIVLGVYLSIARIKKSSKEKLVRKYELRRSNEGKYDEISSSNQGANQAESRVH